MPYRKMSGKQSGPKKTAWGWFSKYIRLRDAMRTTGIPEYCVCVTCGMTDRTSEMDAGHMIPGRTGGILFDEEIVRAQCRMCNREGNGEKQAFRMVMVAEHGEEFYELKLQARKTNTPLGDLECRLIADEYRKKYRDLAKKCGVR